jgi:hypothetical protein
MFLPASAVPGSLAHVPLPVDSQGNDDYTASDQQLTRDGVLIGLWNGYG